MKRASIVRIVLGLVGLAAVGRPALAGSVAAGSLHSAVVKTTDSTAWAWGYNANGRLGDATTTQRTTPVQVGSLTGLVAVAAGSSHTLWLKSNGTVWASGLNTSGQLGDGTTTQRTTPVQVKVNGTTYLTGVTAIAVGDNHSLALKSDGTVVAWGANGNGQLGNSTTSTGATSYPVAVSGLTGVAGIAGGSTHSLAVKSDATAWAWGYNGSGRLGDGTTTQRTSPVQVKLPDGSFLTGVASVAGGGSHSLAVRNDGTAWSWGNNANGRLGDGTTTQRTSAVQVSGLTGVVAIAGGTGHSVALLSDGTVFTFGLNNYGQLGDGGVTTQSELPALVVGVTDAISVVAAGDHTLAVSSTGVVWVWGRNSNGQLGDGTTENRFSPVSISGPSFAWKVATPAFSPGSNTYTTTVSVAISCATSGATIRYTTDGSDPTPASTQYSTAVSIMATTTLKAKAWKTGMPDSNVGTGVYELKVVRPTLTPGSGNYNTPQSVTMATTTTGSPIRYTTDGSDPSETSSLYATPVTVDGTTTLKARAFKDGWTTSDAASAIYTMNVASPVLTPGGGTYAGVQTVTVTTATPNASLHYTTGGAEPTPSDPTVAPGATVTVDRSLTLKVKGFKTGSNTSATTSGVYFLSLGTAGAPTMEPPAGTYTSTQSVTLSSPTPGATIRYTLDGTVPGLSSPIYAAPIVVDTSETVKARAYKADWTPSATASATYTINAGAAAAPILTPGSGNYSAQLNVAVTCPTPGATIRYTTTGFDPTDTDAVIPYGGTIVVDRALTIKARAWVGGLLPSAVATRSYRVTGAVAAGDNFTLALKSDGTVWAWGENSSGQLGDETTTQRSTPAAVHNLASVIAIAAGRFHALALKSDGTVWAWGSNSDGQLGDNTTTQRTAPVPVSGLSDVVAIAAGSVHSLALKRDGTVRAWGDNIYGQLGDNTTTQRLTPVPVSGLTGVTALAAGSMASHSLALKTDGLASGTVWAWGRNTTSQLGDGTTTQRTTPVSVLSNVTDLARGIGHSLAVRSDGTVWSWGRNEFGQLGDGTTDPHWTPAQVSYLSGVIAVAAGGFPDGFDTSHSVALKADGSVMSWGRNNVRQLGDSSTTNKTAPTATGWIGHVIAVAAGARHSVALRDDGTVWAWGYNFYGQLGISGGGTRSKPGLVPDLSLAGNDWLDADPDHDGLSNRDEAVWGSDPGNPDTNGDGILDGPEVASGMSPTNPDMDGDTVPNSVERAEGTDPFRSDTDGDGVPDGQDCFPLDSSRWQCPAPVPGDSTPPGLTLTEPTNAVLVSSVP